MTCPTIQALRRIAPLPTSGRFLRLRIRVHYWRARTMVVHGITHHAWPIAAGVTLLHDLRQAEQTRLR